MARKRVPFSGTCQELLDKIQGEGVVTPDGVAHPGEPGTTRPEISVSLAYRMTDRQVERQGFACPDGQFFTDHSDCQANCRWRIGEIPCMPTKALTYSATIVPKLEFTLTTWRIQYTPPRGTSAAGKAEVTRWHKAVDAHETRHREDAKKREQEFRTTYGKRRTKYFRADTFAEAEERVKAWIEDQVERIPHRWVQLNKEDADAFHGTPAGGELDPPDCSLF